MQTQNQTPNKQWQHPFTAIRLPKLQRRILANSLLSRKTKPTPYVIHTQSPKPYPNFPFHQPQKSLFHTLIFPYLIFHACSYFIRIKSILPIFAPQNKIKNKIFYSQNRHKNYVSYFLLSQYAKNGKNTA